MPTSKTQSSSPFLKNYKRMKVIIIENLYPKRGIVNGTIGYVQTPKHYIHKIALDSI